MTTTVVHINQPHDVYIGRAVPRRRLAASKWANPYKIGPDGTRDEVVAKFKAYLMTRPDLLSALPELRGKRLGCWCKPDHACHGDVLAEMADEGNAL